MQLTNNLPTQDTILSNPYDGTPISPFRAVEDRNSVLSQTYSGCTCNFKTDSETKLSSLQYRRIFFFLRSIYYYKFDQKQY